MEFERSERSADRGSGGEGIASVTICRWLAGLFAVWFCATVAGGLISAPTALAEESCPNASARQGASDNLPDCRAYEQVTPVNKGDSADLFSTSSFSTGTYAFETKERGYASEDGNEFLLGTFAASFANGVSGQNFYVFKRDAKKSKWTTTAVSQPSLGVQSLQNVVFDPSDFSQLGVEDLVGSVFLENDEIYNLVGSTGSSLPSLAQEPFFNLTNGVQGVAGASTDLSHVVIASRNHTLVPPATSLDEESNALYESVEGQLRLVDLDNGGSLLNPCGAELGQDWEAGGTHNAVSADGAKIFFTAPDPQGTGPGCWEGNTTPQENPPELYMRVNGTTTVDISGKPESGVSDTTLYPAVYVGADAEGKRVFFMTQTELTVDDTGHASELYEYNTVTEKLKRISRGDPNSPVEGKVDFVAAISSDSGTVYFTASGVLAPGVPPLEAGERKEGQAYLYRYDTSTEETRYIAKIGVKEYPQREREFVNLWWRKTGGLRAGEEGSTEVGLDAQANWYATADGRYLVFVSNEELTGYKSAPAPGVTCKSLVSGKGSSENCAEVYRYSVESEEKKESAIVCVSCGPPGMGIPPVDNAEFARSASEHAPAGAPPRPISEEGEEEGKYVFFDTASALVPQVIGGKVHVYEWHEGVISLISPPGDPGNAFFVGSSADGSNVFFGTHAQLAPQDTDVSGDLYDARIDGGFRGLAATVCIATGCQGVPATPPIFATPASVTFEGAGNFPPPKTKSLTDAQKLAKALKVCKRDRNKRRRARCKAHVRKQYGGAHKSTKSNRRGK